MALSQFPLDEDHNLTFTPQADEASENVLEELMDDLFVEFEQPVESVMRGFLLLRLILQDHGFTIPDLPHDPTEGEEIYGIKIHNEEWYLYVGYGPLKDDADDAAAGFDFYVDIMDEETLNDFLEGDETDDTDVEDEQ